VLTLTDVPGIEVGHAQDEEALTGCTVILCRHGAVAGVDQRGGAPGTRETDLLKPVNFVEHVHAVLLTGGSAFGLEAAGGVVRYLEERGSDSTWAWRASQSCRLR
jgi:L-aminopeptidase/D-esterase-like protein